LSNFTQLSATPLGFLWSANPFFFSVVSEAEVKTMTGIARKNSVARISVKTSNRSFWGVEQARVHESFAKPEGLFTARDSEQLKPELCDLRRTS
jgi:hypothetical protein